MRQRPPSSIAPRIGAPTVSAALALTLLGPLSATAQIVAGSGQRGAVIGVPGQSGPVTSQPPVFMSGPGSVYRQPSYPQIGPPQFTTNRYAPGEPSAPQIRVYSPWAPGSGTQVFGPSQPFPGQSRSFVTGPNGSLAPGASDSTQSSRSGSEPETSDSRQPPQRLYSNRLIRPGMPVPAQNPPSAIHVTTSTGQRPLPSREYNNYIYAPVAVYGGPSLLGGYYYGNYSNSYYADGPCYPSVYSSYPGFPEYIINPGVIVLSDPYYPAYVTPPQPFYAPVYQVTYNQNNYYVASQDRAQQIQDGGETATHALKNAYPEGSFQAAFGDIQVGWKGGDISLIRKHIRDSDTTLSVYFKGKYSYSIASADFVKITRDAFDRLSTVSFEFTRLRKAKNGDVTAYGKHIYQTSGSADTSGGGASADNTVPFSADGSPVGESAQPYGKADDPAAGAEKTIYVSYTLRKHDDQWFIIGVDSSPTDLVK